jgi:hypothetical protein
VLEVARGRMCVFLLLEVVLPNFRIESLSRFAIDVAVNFSPIYERGHETVE